MLLDNLFYQPDSEWLYALLLCQFPDPREDIDAAEIVRAVERTHAIIREVRARLGIAISSSVNLFITTGSQLAAVRYCFDFGCYRTEDPSKVHEANLTYLSLWYTSGREYGNHDGRWKLVGEADNAGSIMISSEPLTRDTSTWLEAPEYSMIYAGTRTGSPTVGIHYLD